MKKLISLLLVAAMMLTVLAGCGAAGNNETTTESTTETTTEAAGIQLESALQALETIWADYTEDEKFAVAGGNIESSIMGNPGNYDMEYAENLTYNLLVPADQLANVDEAATMIHMMNANSFTSGVVHLKDGVEAADFAATMRDAVQGNMWMCGFPETLVIADFGNGYVLVAFGVNELMTPFQTHLGNVYADAEILYNEPIAG